MSAVSPTPPQLASACKIPHSMMSQPTFHPTSWTTLFQVSRCHEWWDDIPPCFYVFIITIILFCFVFPNQWVNMMWCNVVWENWLLTSRLTYALKFVCFMWWYVVCICVVLIFYVTWLDYTFIYFAVLVLESRRMWVGFCVQVVWYV